jgi:hypothetical protein
VLALGAILAACEPVPDLAYAPAGDPPADASTADVADSAAPDADPAAAADDASDAPATADAPRAADAGSLACGDAGPCDNDKVCCAVPGADGGVKRIECMPEPACANAGGTVLGADP